MEVLDRLFRPLMQFMGAIWFCPLSYDDPKFGVFVAKQLSLKDAVIRADEIQRENRSGIQCHISRLVASFSDEDVVLLKSLMKSDYQHTTIARVLNEAGHEISALMVSRHRGSGMTQCKCGTFDE